MGKKKNKLKTYQPPLEKFVAVVNPWGRPPNRPQDRHRPDADKNIEKDFLNNVGAWFELMLRDRHPGTRVDVIYVQKTRTDIIIQLPGEVDIRPLLGSHAFARICNPPYNKWKEADVAHIYEYDYEHHDDPSRRNWMQKFPSYEKIVDRFPIKYPYPFAQPAPPPPLDVKWALRLPEDLQQFLYDRSNAAAMAAQQPREDEGATTSPSPYQSAVVSGSQQAVSVASEVPQVKKIDPYERADMDRRLLQGSDGVKQEPLASFSVKVEHTLKSEQGEQPYLGDYRPSEELLRSMATLTPNLAPAGVKSELAHVKREPTIQPARDYEPSAELLATFASLPPELRGTPSATPTPNPSHVKREIPASAVTADPRVRQIQRTRQDSLKREREDTLVDDDTDVKRKRIV